MYPLSLLPLFSSHCLSPPPHSLLSHCPPHSLSSLHTASPLPLTLSLLSHCLPLPLPLPPPPHFSSHCLPPPPHSLSSLTLPPPSPSPLPLTSLHTASPSPSLLFTLPLPSLSLLPHSSPSYPVLAEDAIRAALKDYKTKKTKAAESNAAVAM